MRWHAHHVCGDGALDDIEDVVFVNAAHLRPEVERHLLSDDRGHSDQLPVFRPEPVQSLVEHLLDQLWHWRTGQRG
jgi:hypothetical protein